MQLKIFWNDALIDNMTEPFGIVIEKKYLVTSAVGNNQLKFVAQIDTASQSIYMDEVSLVLGDFISNTTANSTNSTNQNSTN